MSIQTISSTKTTAQVVLKTHDLEGKGLSQTLHLKRNGKKGEQWSDAAGRTFACVDNIFHPNF